MKILIVCLTAAVLACQPDTNVDATPSESSDDNREAAGQVARSGEQRDEGNTDTVDAARGKVTVLFFGTSLTAGYGLDPGQAFPNLIARNAAADSLPITAINAGLSGETSAGALRRISWTMQRPVDIVVLETGGNDALRALNADSLEANLSAIVLRIRGAQPAARILLAVMEAPPNLGQTYTARFRRAYVEVARRNGLTLVPFLLDGVAGEAGFNQADGVHPNVRGEAIVAANVWRVLRPVVEEVYRLRVRG
ncbi:MAG: arylesterase [Gemmatimonadaceae bacterium]